MKMIKTTSPSKDNFLPDWIGDDRVHASHRSNLLRKDYDFYSQYNWTEPTDIQYHWA
jgi:hypothetical protein